MANTTTTSLNDLIPSIVSEALFIASERSVIRPLVRNFTIPNGSGNTLTVPNYPQVTAITVAEATDLAGGSGDIAVSTNGAVITLGEVGVMTLITDVSVESAASNVPADVGRVFGEAIARKLEGDLSALFTGFTTTLGNDSTALTLADIFHAITLLTNQGIPVDGMVVVLNPKAAFDVKSTTSNAFVNPNSGSINERIMGTGYLGLVGGVPVYESSNVSETSGVNTSAVFHRDALGLAMSRDLRIEMQRDASMRGHETVASARYGVAELIDSYGVALLNQSSLG